MISPNMVINLIALFMGLMVVTLVDLQTRGFVSTFIACKLSKGKKIFLMIKSLNGGYFRSGKLCEENQIKFKDSNNKPKLLTIEDGTYKESWFGIEFLRFDEFDNKLETKDKIKYTFDPAINENLYERSQKQPPKNNPIYKPKEKILVIIFIGVAAIAYYVFKIRQQNDFAINELLTIKELVKACASNKVVIP